MKFTTTALIAFLISLTSFAQDNTKPQGLFVGDKASLFKGKDNNGIEFNLADQLKKGSVVMVFYRGEWCPYCNKELSLINDSLSFILAKGATVVAISPETAENVSKTVSKTKATFPIISDGGMAIMKSYKVNFTVDEDTVEKYKKYWIDFTISNGENAANLPIPATYIIGSDGIIKYVFFNADYRKRASVKEILDHL